MTTTGAAVFLGCTSLASIEIPNSVTSISFGTFYGCTSLSSIKMPGSVTRIDKKAFEVCSELTEVIVDATFNPEVILQMGLKDNVKIRRMSQNIASSVISPEDNRLANIWGIFHDTGRKSGTDGSEPSQSLPQLPDEMNMKIVQEVFPSLEEKVMTVGEWTKNLTELNSDYNQVMKNIE